MGRNAWLAISIFVALTPGCRSGWLTLASEGASSAPATTPPAIPFMSASIASRASASSPAPVTSWNTAFYTTPPVVGASHVISVGPSDDLRKAIAAAHPGDVFELRAGTYSMRLLSIVASGTPKNWIVIRGAAGSRPVIDLLNSCELSISGSYILLQNLDVKNGAGNNLHIIPNGAKTPLTNVIIRDVKSYGLASGTGAALKIAGNWRWGKGVPTDGIYIEDSDFSGSRGNAIIDAVAVRHAVVRNCYLHDGVNGRLRCPGIFFKAGSSDILIEGNLIRGIRGNSAIMVGGDSRQDYFDALYAKPPVESVHQVVRNNLLADFDDSAFDIRGVHGARIYNNTIVTQTSFCIFRLTWGDGGTSFPSGNYDVDISNNLVLCTGSPRFAENDGNGDATVRFGPQLWGGSLGQSSGAGIPTFPLPNDVAPGVFGTVLVEPSFTGITSRADALARFGLVPGSPAKGAGSANVVAPLDILGRPRSATRPSIGAFE
jgi:hypothetical protein